MANESHERHLVVAVATEAIQEADLRVERVADLHEAQRVVPIGRRVSGARTVAELVAGATGCLGLRAPPVERPVLARADAAVERVGAVVVASVARRHSLHRKRTHARSRGQLARDARDTVRRRGRAIVDIFREELQHTDREAGHTSRHASAADDGHGAPNESMPIRRVKNSSTACGVPAEKVPAFSRKNGRFSGKKSGKRVRFVRCSSTST